MLLGLVLGQWLGLGLWMLLGLVLGQWLEHYDVHDDVMLRFLLHSYAIPMLWGTTSE